MHGTITYSTHKLDYLLRFSNRRTMAITVYPNGAVEVIAPRGATQREVEIRLRKRARWIYGSGCTLSNFVPALQRAAMLVGRLIYTWDANIA